MNRSLIENIRWFAAAWRAISLIVGVFGFGFAYLLMQFVPTLKGNSAWLFGFVYMAVLALVFLIIDIHHAVRPGTPGESYRNLKEAAPKILSAIISASRSRGTAPVQVRVLGVRLTAISTVFMDLLSYQKENQLGGRRIDISIRHVKPEYLETIEPPARASIPIDSINRLRDQSELIRHVTRELDAAYRSNSQMTLSWTVFSEIPYLWAIEVDGVDLYWGFVLWDRIDSNWNAPENRCFHVRRSDEIFGWITNRMEFLDQWGESESPSQALGHQPIEAGRQLIQPSMRIQGTTAESALE